MYQRAFLSGCGLAFGFSVCRRISAGADAYSTEVSGSFICSAKTYRFYLQFHQNPVVSQIPGFPYWFHLTPMETVRIFIIPRPYNPPSVMSTDMVFDFLSAALITLITIEHFYRLFGFQVRFFFCRFSINL